MIKNIIRTTLQVVLRPRTAHVGVGSVGGAAVVVGADDDDLVGLDLAEELADDVVGVVVEEGEGAHNKTCRGRKGEKST